MFRNPRFVYREPPQVPHLGFTINQTAEQKVTTDDLRAEAIVTWNSARSLRRLKKANAAQNHGQILQFGQYVQWLKNHLGSLPTATLEEPEATVQAMTDENCMPQDRDSSTYGLPQDAYDHLIQSHGILHGHYVRL